MRLLLDCEVLIGCWRLICLKEYLRNALYVEPQTHKTILSLDTVVRV